MTDRAEAEVALGPGEGVRWRVPWTLIVFLAALTLPWIGTRYDVFLGTQIAIYSLFAMSLNLLLGTTGLVSFGHAAYFGIGSYTCGIFMKTLGVPFWLAFPAAGLMAAGFAAVFGFFCVRLTKIYFAMLTLAFAQIVWAVCFKWNDVTGGDQGLSDVLFGIFNRGVFADFLFWSKSADVMIMTILGGMHHFWGPAVGALVLTLLNQQITAYTQYWPFVLGAILVVLLFAFPGGILGALEAALSRIVRRRDA